VDDPASRVSLAFNSGCIGERSMRTLIGTAVPAMTFLLLVAVGIDLTVRDFALVRQQRALVLAGLFGPLILLPPLAAALAHLFGASDEITAGILLVAACPIGSVSNLYSYLGRASTALAVTLTGLSCLLASLTIPLAGRGISFFLGRPLQIEAPIGLLAAQLLVVLALPVLLGMSARRAIAPLALRAAPILQRVSVAGTLVILGLIVADDWGAFVGGLSGTVSLAAAFVGVSAAAGWISALPLSRNRRDWFTMAAQFGARNIGVATAIAVTFLGRLEFARFAATYSLIELPLMLAAVWLFRFTSQTEVA
jgi:bile acid:Na+ symporter, BASS family